jgi:8-oxo-dGTP diphosphatase
MSPVPSKATAYLHVQGFSQETRLQPAKEFGEEIAVNIIQLAGLKLKIHRSFNVLIIIVPEVQALSRQYPKKPIVGVGAIILDGDKILLEKRKNSPGKGKWAVPGGLVELGESAEDAVIREVKEETGLDVYEPRLVDVVTYVSRGEKGAVLYHYIIIDYLVTVRRGKPKAASDAEDLKWVPFNEVEEYNLTESFRWFFLRNRQKLENPSFYL